jgi:FtsP/CotA-like multicopper oxidase with cupredoxin domain
MRTRKSLLMVALAAVLAVVAGAVAWLLPNRDAAAARLVGPDSQAVLRAEEARTVAAANTIDVTLTAAPATVDLGGQTLDTWAFNGAVPAPTIRATAGDVLRARVVNDLPEELTVHWHGIALRNDMDGVPDLTQDPIAPGGEFVYEFTLPHPGSYFYHPHTGTQLDRGLYGALIVDDPGEPATSADIPVLLDDWIDGTGQNPDEVLDGLTSMPGMDGGSMPGMDHGSGPNMDHGSMPGMDRGSGPGMDMGHSDSSTATSPLGTDIADVGYPMYLINGRAPGAADVFPVSAGEQVRLRLINAAASTPFRVAFGGGQMTVVATDGFPVDPVDTDALIIGMGERYDVLVTVPGDGAFPLVAAVEGGDGQALGVLQAGDGALPAVDVRPTQLDGRLLTYDDLQATAEVTLPAGPADRSYQVSLIGDMMSYRWAVDAPQEGGVTMPVRAGERVRLELINNTAMWHPMHLHGHTFQLVTDSGTGPRKDTVNIPPNASVTVEFLADNPGQWAVHCHTLYHAEAGMHTTVSYVE